MHNNRPQKENVAPRFSYLSFVKSYPWLSAFGTLCTFSSSFGQTFFISLFVPLLLIEFSLSNADFGLLYSSATVLSAVSLIIAGKWIDIISLKTYMIFIIALMLAATLLMASAWSVFILFAALYLLRFGFQGMLTHTSHTTMARYFALNRGKAVSLANLGYPIGEGTLPLFGALLIGAVGWRYSWLTVTGFIVIVLIPVFFYLIRRIPADPRETLVSEGTSLDEVSEKTWTRRLVLKDLRFYVILPAFITSPFLLTGFFLYQLTLADFKGWSTELIAGAFMFFAAGRIVFSLIGGPLIDYFTARKLFPFMLIPAAAGFFILSLSVHPVTAFAYMLLLGTTEGLASGIKSSLWAEIYGIKTLGTVRSLMSFVIILSTALSPFIFGWLLDYGITFNQIALSAVIYIFAASIISLPIRKA